MTDEQKVVTLLTVLIFTVIGGCITAGYFNGYKHGFEDGSVPILDQVRANFVKKPEHQRKDQVAAEIKEIKKAALYLSEKGISWTSMRIKFKETIDWLEKEGFKVTEVKCSYAIKDLCYHVSWGTE